jgi:ubiquinone/menaquinone biosynthesis C-methylase UbiE
MSSETSTIQLSPRGLMHLLFNGARAIDVVETAYGTGILAALDKGTLTLAELSTRFEMDPLRLYKFLDCLESMGLVRREQRTDALGEAKYTALPGVLQAAEKVVGPTSLERDREQYSWNVLHRRLNEVLRKQHSMPREAFDWPPSSPKQVADFEASMAAGLGPILEVFREHGDKLWREGQRLLDVGGGDGTLAAHLLKQHPALTVDVYNLPATQPLVERTRDKHGLSAQRMGFMGGDFLNQPLPTGYDALSFVRVLHDWPAETARHLMKAAHAALPSGGRILICEEFRTPERLTAQFFWSYFLMGVDTCVSRLREVEYYLEVLEYLGFQGARVLPGPFELIVATKP